MAADDPGDDGDGEGPTGSAPLGDLAERIRSRREGVEPEAEAADPADDAFGLGPYFSESTYAEIDADDLWDTLDADEPTPGGVEAGEAPNEHIVPKRSYCESCPKEAFSEPPAVRCSHPGTSIVEFVDIDHIRVRNCPVVAERQALGEEERGPVTPGSFGSQ